jgi:hypothetical protein
VHQPIGRTSLILPALCEEVTQNPNGWGHQAVPLSVPLLPRSLTVGSGPDRVAETSDTEWNPRLELPFNIIVPLERRRRGLQAGLQPISPAPPRFAGRGHPWCPPCLRPLGLEPSGSGEPWDGLKGADRVGRYQEGATCEGHIRP